MTEAKKILLVGDYGQDDLAFKEVQQRLYDLAQDAGLNIHVDIVSVDPFNTLQTAAVVAKAVNGGRYDLVYHNTAPRKDEDKARIDNHGEGLAYTEVMATNGNTVQVIGVNSGHKGDANTFALLPPEPVYQVHSDTKGSQFRSRDIFPPHVITALAGTLKREDVPLDIPQIPEDLNPLVQKSWDTAETLLAQASLHQLSRHGNAANGYITFVDQRTAARPDLNDVLFYHSGVEADFIPLKSTQNEWIEAGFVATQLALNSAHPGKRTLVVLPRTGDTLKEADTLYDATLDNGAHIVTSDLRTLAFVKQRLGSEGVKAYAKEGRSTSIAGGRITISGNAQKVSDVELDVHTRLPEGFVPAYTDGYGNIKLAITHDALLNRLNIETGKEHARYTVGISVGKHDVDALVANDSFAVNDGDMALSKGSSGWAATPGGKPDRFAEIFLRGGNAADELGYPQPGTCIRIAVKKVEPNAHPSVTTEGGPTIEMGDAAARALLDPPQARRAAL